VLTAATRAPGLVATVFAGMVQEHERASKAAIRDKKTLFEVLAADSAVTEHLPVERLKQLLDPAQYVGQAHAYVDAALALHTARAQRAHSKE
jgi:3-carboxy-cis,cis-muconate cycloisomerase